MSYQTKLPPSFAIYFNEIYGKLCTPNPSFMNRLFSSTPALSQAQGVLKSDLIAIKEKFLAGLQASQENLDAYIKQFEDKNFQRRIHWLGVIRQVGLTKAFFMYHDVIDNLPHAVTKCLTEREFLAWVNPDTLTPLEFFFRNQYIPVKDTETQCTTGELTINGKSLSFNTIVQELAPHQATKLSPKAPKKPARRSDRASVHFVAPLANDLFTTTGNMALPPDFLSMPSDSDGSMSSGDSEEMPALPHNPTIAKTHTFPLMPKLLLEILQALEKFVSQSSSSEKIGIAQGFLKQLREYDEVKLARSQQEKMPKAGTKFCQALEQLAQQPYVDFQQYAADISSGSDTEDSTAHNKEPTLLDSIGELIGKDPIRCYVAKLRYVLNHGNYESKPMLELQSILEDFSTLQIGNGSVAIIIAFRNHLMKLKRTSQHTAIINHEIRTIDRFIANDPHLREQFERAFLLNAHCHLLGEIQESPLSTAKLAEHIYEKSKFHDLKPFLFQSSYLKSVHLNKQLVHIYKNLFNISEKFSSFIKRYPPSDDTFVMALLMNNTGSLDYSDNIQLTTIFGSHLPLSYKLTDIINFYINCINKAHADPASNSRMEKRSLIAGVGEAIKLLPEVLRINLQSFNETPQDMSHELHELYAPQSKRRSKRV